MAAGKPVSHTETSKIKEREREREEDEGRIPDYASTVSVVSFSPFANIRASQTGYLNEIPRAKRIWLNAQEILFLARPKRNALVNEFTGAI